MRRRRARPKGIPLFLRLDRRSRNVFTASLAFLEQIDAFVFFVGFEDADQLVVIASREAGIHPFLGYTVVSHSIAPIELFHPFQNSFAGLFSDFPIDPIAIPFLFSIEDSPIYFFFIKYR